MNTLTKISTPFDKKLLSLDPKNCSLEEICFNLNGLFHIDLNKVAFECFLKKSETLRLFVFYSAGGRSNKDTKFNRLTWSSFLDGFCFYIEDPMYKSMDKIPTAWYYGDAERCFVLDSLEIVRRIAKIHGIKNSDIIFIGSSSGGYAALYAANQLTESLAYVYNPQIRLADWASGKNLNKIKNFYSIEEDKFNRDNIEYIENNINSKFIIVFNIFSKDDRSQIEPWLDRLNINISDGLFKYKNTQFILNSLNYKSPHNATLSVHEFLITLKILNETSCADPELLMLYMQSVARNIETQESDYYSRLWYDLLRQLPADLFNFPKVISTGKINLSYFKNDIKINFNLYATRLNNSIVSEAVIPLDLFLSIDRNIINDYCTSYSLNLIFEKTNRFVKIKHRSKKSEEFITFTAKNLKNIISIFDKNLV